MDYQPLPIFDEVSIFLWKSCTIRLRVSATGVINVLTGTRSCPRRLKMKTFTIENETNNITIHASASEAEAVLDAQRFATEEELSTLAADWPSSRLIEVFNSLPGVTPVRKFQNRATGVSRIWKAIQSLGEALPSQTCGRIRCRVGRRRCAGAGSRVRGASALSRKPARPRRNPYPARKPKLPRPLRHTRPTARPRKPRLPTTPPRRPPRPQPPLTKRFCGFSPAPLKA